MDADDWEKFASLVENWEGSKGSLAATLRRKADRLRTPISVRRINSARNQPHQPTPTENKTAE
jgi:hypothetical protein